jgi:photosystem II stability/assembly factor-like uncharacterized protein
VPLIALLSAAAALAESPGARPIPQSFLSRPLVLEDEAAAKAARGLMLSLARAGGRIVAVGAGGTILLSDDDGRSFRSARQVPVTGTLTDVAFYDAELGFAVGHEGIILRTIDGGENWELRAQNARSGGPLMAVWPVSARRVLAVGAYGQFLRSEDGGKSWESRPFELGGHFGVHINDVVVAPPQEGNPDGISIAYLSTEVAMLYRSSDGGLTFQPLRLPGEGPFLSGLALPGPVLLIFDASGAVLRSSDGGRRWQIDSSIGEAPLFAAAALDYGRLVAVGARGVLAVSADAGKNFSAFQLQSAASLTDILALGDDVLLLAGDDGLLRLPGRRLLPDAPAIPDPARQLHERAL